MMGAIVIRRSISDVLNICMVYGVCFAMGDIDIYSCVVVRCIFWREDCVKIIALLYEMLGAYPYSSKIFDTDYGL